MGDERTPSLAATVTALGVAQIVSWGTLFYTIAVLGPALGAAAGVSDVLLFGSYSAGLFVSGVVAPWIGRTIDDRGGRSVLAGGSALAALACAALALVQGPVSLALAWLLAGAAMAATLYDPAFATLHQVAPANYRRAVTALTLFGGFASTVFWPLSQLLLDVVGVRATFAFYAVLNGLLCLPLHLAFVPRDRRPGETQQGTEPRVPDEPAAAAARAPFLWLATALALASVIASALSAHLIGMIAASGLTTRDAVLIGALIGPMQVVGRLMDLAMGRRVGPIAAGSLAFAALAASVVVLALVRGSFALAVLFAVLYGWSNGVMTIVRGTVPAELFGRRGYGALLGRLAMPQFVARALAPAALAALLVVDPAYALALGALIACGVVAWIAYRRAVAAPPVPDDGAGRQEKREASR